jgi:hypothetical protein
MHPPDRSGRRDIRAARETQASLPRR